jgi:hypothetical protein
MNEWTAAAPVIVDTAERPSRRRQRTRRPLRRWAVGVLATLAIFLAWSGGLLLVGQAVWGYTIPTMIAPIALLAAGQIVVVALVYAITWRYGRL